MFLHLDLDCFFVSAERSIKPELKGIPIAVGSRSDLNIFEKNRSHTKLINKNSGAFVAPVFDSQKKQDFRSRFVDIKEGKEKIRGIVTTSSYEAREFGIKTAMSLDEALRLYPKLVVIPSNYRLYHKLSFELNSYLHSVIPKVEQFSIDEWFGDLRGWIKDDEASAFAKYIQQNVLKKFDLPLSIGISKAKWIAKLATEDAKPIGIYKVDDIEEYIKEIPIKEFPGIGRGYQKRLKGRGISTLADIKKHKALFYSWGKPGIQLYNRVHGIDNEGIDIKGERKSIGISRTFDPIFDKKEVRRRVLILCRNIVYMVKELRVNPSTYYLKLNYEYGIKSKEAKTVTRMFSEKLFKEIMLEVFEKIYKKNYGVIKLTVNVSNFIERSNKTYYMLDLQEDMKQQKLTDNIQKLREKFGLDIIKNANEL